MPVNPLAYAMVVFNVLSAASIVLAAAILVRLVAKTKDVPSRPFLVAIVALQLPLFLLSGGLGLTVFDPYLLGYRGLAIPAMMAALVAIGWRWRIIEIPIWIGLAALLHALNVYDSHNIWDYLVDPLASIVAIDWLIVDFFLRRRRRA